MKLPRGLPQVTAGPGLVISESGRIKDIPIKRIDGEPVMLHEFSEIAASIIAFFQHPDFPKAPITPRIKCEGMEVNGLAGASEIWMKIMIDCERHWEWYEKWGMVAKIIAENAHGRENNAGMVRKVNMIVVYNDKNPKRKVLSVLFEVGSTQVRYSPTGSSKDVIKLQ